MPLQKQNQFQCVQLLFFEHGINFWYILVKIGVKNIFSVPFILCTTKKQMIHLSQTLRDTKHVFLLKQSSCRIWYILQSIVGWYKTQCCSKRRCVLSKVTARLSSIDRSFVLSASWFIWKWQSSDLCKLQATDFWTYRFPGLTFPTEHLFNEERCEEKKEVQFHKFFGRPSKFNAPCVKKVYIFSFLL